MPLVRESEAGFRRPTTLPTSSSQLVSGSFTARKAYPDPPAKASYARENPTQASCVGELLRRSR
jgi:hypothetical protein